MCRPGSYLLPLASIDIISFFYYHRMFLSILIAERMLLMVWSLSHVTMEIASVLCRYCWVKLLSNVLMKLITTLLHPQAHVASKLELCNGPLSTYRHRNPFNDNIIEVVVIESPPEYKQTVQRIRLNCQFYNSTKYVRLVIHCLMAPNHYMNYVD